MIKDDDAFNVSTKNFFTDSEEIEEVKVICQWRHDNQNAVSRNYFTHSTFVAEHIFSDYIKVQYDLNLKSVIPCTAIMTCLKSNPRWRKRFDFSKNVRWIGKSIISIFCG